MTKARDIASMLSSTQTLSNKTFVAPALGTVTAGNLSNTAIVYPSGHVTNVFRLSDNSADEYATTNQHASSKVAFDALSWSATSGRHYLVYSCVVIAPYRNAGSPLGRTQVNRLYVGTNDRDRGDTQGDTSVDTLLMHINIGRNIDDSMTAGKHGYYEFFAQGFFTAGSTAPHYVYLTIASPDSNVTARANKSATEPWTVIIYEVMP